MVTRLSHLLCIAGILLGIPVFASPNSESSLLKDARSYYMNGHYDLAKKKYEELIKLDPKSLDYNFEMGLTYYHSEVEREKALFYFEKALDLDSKLSIPEIYYYCGLSCLYNEELVKAKSYLEKFTNFLDMEKGAELKQVLNRYIEMCDNAMAAADHSEKFNLKNPESLNTVFSEYAPILMKDGTTMIYTARKRGSTGGKKSADAVFYEDIYMGLKQNDSWVATSKIDSLKNFTAVPINTSRHNAAVSFNSDESKLFLYKDADLFVSEKIEGKWAEPVKLNDNLNTKEHEPSVFVSADEKYLLFVSTRSGGNGGRDIYISEKGSDGDWGKATNLGTVINTPYDDDAPFLTPDGKELYFASKGHNSMGGFDIFRSVKSGDGSWSKPENLGKPFNSTADDIYYLKSGDGETQMLSSNRKSTLGAMDIYIVEPVKNIEFVVENANGDSHSSDSTGEQIHVLNTTNGSENISATKISNVFHPTSIAQNFQQQFGYNSVEINADDLTYLGFLNQVSTIINQKGFVDILIESSASYVPTTTFGTNKKLAESRAETARVKIQKALIDAGYKANQFSFKVDCKVQGPAYKNDFDSNQKAYEPYQYIKLSFR